MSQDETPRYLAGLNPEQREAVLHEGSPLLILAGAGSGKTRVITCKIAYLVAERGREPRSILAVTFTNKAAGEMAERVAQMVPDAHGMTVKTFHAFGAWLLRRYGASLGLAPAFAIYDDDDAISLLSSITEGIARRELSRYAHLISRAKDYCLTPEDDLRAISPDPRLPELYARYQKRLGEIGNVDFGDLIARSVELLRTNGEARRRIQERFTTVLVDEYQDSNVAQYELLKALVGERTYVCVVGDDDQSIYRFRGAEVRNILTFNESFPGTKVIRLEQNYRSTQTILGIASAVVAHNQSRLGKTLRTGKPAGPRALLAYLDDQDEEASFCSELLRGGDIGGTAILYRTNAQSLPFETLFTRKGIPYRIIGALRFYDREEIKDALALLTFLVNPRDEIGYRRIVNKPARGIGAASIGKIVDRAVASGGDLLAASRDVASGLSKRAASGLDDFVRVIDALRAALDEKPLYELVAQALSDSGLLELHRMQDEIGGTQKMRNLDQLVNAASEYGNGVEGLALFLEHVELDRSQIAGEDEEDGDRVTLITMHNTKGLEFDRVFITGLDDELFPGRRDDTEDEIEEERRLFYVSITRAREELVLTSCRARLVWGRYMQMFPSRFLAEIPEELLEVRSGVPLGRGAPAGRGAGEADDYPDEVYGDDWEDDAPTAGDRTEDRYALGQNVYHEDYGTGTICKTWYNGRQFMVQVRFESGKIAQFFPKFQPLERISRDG